LSLFKTLIDCLKRINYADWRSYHTIGSVYHRFHRNGAVGSGGATPAKVLLEVKALAEQPGDRRAEYRVR
jgi:hypothetical protein